MGTGENNQLVSLLSKMQAAALPPGADTARLDELQEKKNHQLMLNATHQSAPILDASVMLRKGIYDKVAAQVIL